MSAPYFTIMNHPYSADVDRFFNDLLDRKPDITGMSGYYVFFAEPAVSIWISNRWYAYASQANQDVVTPGLGEKLWYNLRPSRRTMVRLHQYIRDNCPPSKGFPTVEELVKGGKA